MPEEKQYTQFLENVFAKLVPETIYQFDVTIVKTGGSASGELYWRRKDTINAIVNDKPVPLEEWTTRGHGGYDSENEMSQDTEGFRERLYDKIADHAETQLISTKRISLHKFLYSKRTWEAKQCADELLKNAQDTFPEIDVDEALAYQSGN